MTDIRNTNTTSWTRSRQEECNSPLTTFDVKRPWARRWRNWALQRCFCINSALAALLGFGERTVDEWHTRLAPSICHDASCTRDSWPFNLGNASSTSRCPTSLDFLTVFLTRILTIPFLGDHRLRCLMPSLRWAPIPATSFAGGALDNRDAGNTTSNVFWCRVSLCLSRLVHQSGTLQGADTVGPASEFNNSQRRQHRMVWHHALGQ